MSGKRRSHFGRIFRRKGRDGKPLPGFFVRVRRGSTSFQCRAGATYAEACAYLAKLREETQRQDDADTSITPIAFEDFAEIYLTSVQATGAASTYQNVASKVRANFIPAFKGRVLSEIVKKDIGRYIATRERGVSVATRNRDLAVMSSLFRKAIEMGYAETNPVMGIGRPQEAILPVPYVDQVGQRKLIECCEADLRPLVVLALDTGMRVGELLRLEWRDVDRAGRVVTVRAPKNKQPRNIPYGERAASVLADLFEVRVIPIDPAIRDRVLPRISEAWTGQCYGRYRAAVKAAGLPELRFHDLRHIYAVDLVRAGVPLPDVAKLLGHKTLTMTMRYASHAPKDASYRARDLLEAARRGDGPDAVRETA